MGLHFDFSNVKDKDKVCWETITGTPDEVSKIVQKDASLFFSAPWQVAEDGKSARRLGATTQVLIFVCMNLLVGEITEKNWKEVYLRLNMYERATGALRNKTENGRSELVMFTPDEVRAHVGLKMNIVHESMAAFKKNLVRILHEDAVRELRKSEECA